MPEQHHIYGDPKCPCPRCNGANPAYSSADKSAQLVALAELLRAWCAAHGLPLGCADEMRHTLAYLEENQRAWLDAYCTLWDLTNV